MKEYKIDLSMYDGKVREVVSEAVQTKAFDLGSSGWLSCGRDISHTDKPYLFISKRDIGMCCEDEGDFFKKQSYALISAADFLALKPEDVKEKPVPEFKPFDKVLVRDDDNETWNANFFSHIHGETFPYECVFSCFTHCIPYEGNEHLLGTKEDV